MKMPSDRLENTQLEVTVIRDGDPTVPEAILTEKPDVVLAETAGIRWRAP